MSDKEYEMIGSINDPYEDPDYHCDLSLEEINEMEEE